MQRNDNIKSGLRWLDIKNDCGGEMKISACVNKIESVESKRFPLSWEQI